MYLYHFFVSKRYDIQSGNHVFFILYLWKLKYFYLRRREVFWFIIFKT